MEAGQINKANRLLKVKKPNEALANVTLDPECDSYKFLNRYIVDKI